jgi:hypothetical protein
MPIVVKRPPRVKDGVITVSTRKKRKPAEDYPNGKLPKPPWSGRDPRAEKSS